MWEEADSVLAAQLPKPLSGYVYPETVDDESGDVALTETDIAQPAIGVADMVLNHILTDLGVRPDMCIGHSYGEYAALCSAGVIAFGDLITLSEARGRAMQVARRSESGAMVAVSAPADVVAPMVANLTDVVIANLNGPFQTVVSGRMAGIDWLLKACADSGLKATKLNVGAAFHSPMVESAKQPLRDALDRVRFAPSTVPVYANTTAEPHSREPESIKDQLVEHLVSPVRFQDSVDHMRRDGASVFVEVGPGSTLTSLAGGILRETDSVVLGVDHRDGWFGLLNALARLFVAGVSWSAERLHKHCSNHDGSQFGDVRRPTYNRKAQPARETEKALGAPSDSRHQVAAAMERYERLMKMFLESQARVMVEYIGGSSADERRQLVPPRQSEKTQPSGAITAADSPRLTEASGQSDATTDAGNDPPKGDRSSEYMLDRLRSIVASLTGYPPDMLDPDLDLEADLGIDSIKRVEILVALQQQSLLPADAVDHEAKVFSELTTLSEMANTLRRGQVGSVGNSAASVVSRIEYCL